MARVQLIVIGASGRAAAFSALRGGYAPTVLDLFADADLRSRCLVHSIPRDDYPGGFLVAATKLSPTSWLYVGGMENHPDLVGAISQRHKLLGNPPDVLRRVRDPFAVTAALQRQGCHAPDVARPPADVPRDGTWLLKPIRGSGGGGIQPWLGQELPSKPHYLQRLVTGVSMAMAAVADQKGQATLLGVTNQLIGLPWLGAAAYSFCGSIGPICLPLAVRAELQRLAQFLTRQFSLVGLFGVDFVLEDERVHPIEVNPRYTASMELIEAALEVSLIREHTRAATLDLGSCDQVPETPCWGKAVLFARRQITFPVAGPWMDSIEGQLAGFAPPAYADIPAFGATIPARAPILTFFVQADSPEVCRHLLQSQAKFLDQLLGNE